MNAFYEETRRWFESNISDALDAARLWEAFDGGLDDSVFRDGEVLDMTNEVDHALGELGGPGGDAYTSAMSEKDFIAEYRADMGFATEVAEDYMGVDPDEVEASGGNVDAAYGEALVQWTIYQTANALMKDLDTLGQRLEDIAAEEGR